MENMKAGREMDALVAEKVMKIPMNRFGEVIGPPGLGVGSPRNYSTDIAAAMAALYQVCDQNQLSWTIERHESDGRHYIALKGQGEGEFWEQKGYGDLKDLPNLICLAALKAVGG